MRNIWFGEIFYASLIIGGIALVINAMLRGHPQSLLFAIVVLALTGVVFKILKVRYRRRQEEWLGIVQHKYKTLLKLYAPKQGEVLRITFLTEQHQVYDWHFSWWSYRKYNEGDKVIKKKGNLNPEIVS